ncbi:acetylornithine deacetylase [Halioxenophilus sp. WMMB6]|uniref:acetylornithine deacetylase n=1 Tax=Halioxenophilus sp. WMMB6 TaxID=3073815 RepID=UPI00295E8A19|nr:acetylornithine deacetylase [Halioxenophilus sp. WMMB6]
MSKHDLTAQLKGQLSSLVAIPSISSALPHLDCSNRAVVEQLAEWLTQLGFTCELLPVAEQPGKVNLLATLGRGPGGLVLAGHTDTVPYDDSLWQQDPFRLQESEDRWYGLGATDMKGFFPVAIAAASAFTNQPLRAPLMLLATADEESSMCGARELVKLGRPTGRYAVIGEPTGLKPIRAHKGIMMEAIRVTGHSGHSSNPALGRNAMEDMHLVFNELLAFRSELQKNHRNPMFAVATPTLNPGYIHGGDNPNRICGHCELHFDIRPLPGMNLDELRHTLEHRLLRLKEETGMQVVLESLFPGVPAYEESLQSSLVQKAEQLTGYASEAVAFATEAPYLQSLGHETIVLGPGNIDQAHQPNEFIEIGQALTAVETLKSVIAHYCL